MPNSNTLTDVIPQIMAAGLMKLRQMTVMPRLVNTSYSREAAEKGDTVDIPKPGTISAQDVTASNTPPDDSGVTPGKVSISLDQWREAPFFLTDKDMHDAFEGIVPMQVSEAIGVLAEDVNSKILGLYTEVYGFTGTAGTTPFASDLSAATAARKVLNNQKAPTDMRSLVLDPDAMANALGNRAIQDASFRAGSNSLVTGEVGNVLGFTWAEDQQVPSHTTGAAGTVLVDQADVAVGDKTVHFDGLTTKASVGDVFTVAGDTQTYVVVSSTALTGTDGDMTFEPAAKVAWADDAAVTFKASHAVNLAFHRNAFAFASRPLGNPGGFTGGSIIQSIADPVSGLTLRLEVSRQHKRARWSFDVLYGVKTIRPELAARVAG